MSVQFTHVPIAFPLANTLWTNGHLCNVDMDTKFMAFFLDFHLYKADSINQKLPLFSRSFTEKVSDNKEFSSIAGHSSKHHAKGRAHGQSADTGQ